MVGHGAVATIGHSWAKCILSHGALKVMDILGQDKGRARAFVERPRAFSRMARTWSGIAQ